jgi:gliding motility-associated-like protein
VSHRVRITKSGLGCDLDASLLTLYFGDTESLGVAVASLPYSSFGQDTLLQFDLSAFPDRYSGCYRVTVSDTLGNVSAPSAPACLDFCPVLELPDVFTPNGDAVNELFRPLLFRDVALKQVIIYDRWGRIMHQGGSEGFARLWDGIQDSNERPAPEGTYFYYLRYEELSLSGNIPRELRGPITLLR